MKLKLYTVFLLKYWFVLSVQDPFIAYPSQSF